MIAVHTIEVFASQEVKSSLFGQIIEFLGGPPAAPVFMTLMGFSFLYSGKSDLKPKLLRGFKIFLSGYVLNILRGVIPFSLATNLKLDVVKTFPIEKFNEYMILTTVDILQFAGIALIEYSGQTEPLNPGQTEPVIPGQTEPLIPVKLSHLRV
jgi:hypothetical protein